MVLPLYDENPFSKPILPWVTWGLMAINIVVFLLEVRGSDASMRAMVATYGATPSAIARNTGADAGIPPYLTLLTSIFLHGSFLHLFGNMIFLWVFGDDIEEAMGRLRFIAFYVLCGVGASLAFVLSAPQSSTPLVGASGAIAGVLSAYLMLRPCAKVTVLVLRFVVRVSAFWVIGGWVLWQLWQIAVQTQDEVAYMAHLGGLVVGAVLFLLMRPAGVKLFECFEST
jgi:membrane associated rhomboid family serine protease